MIFCKINPNLIEVQINILVRDISLTAKSHNQLNNTELLTLFLINTTENFLQMSFADLFYNNTFKNIVGCIFLAYNTFYKYYILKYSHLKIAKYFIELSFAAGIWLSLFQILAYLFNHELCFCPNDYIIGFLSRLGYLTHLPWISIEMTAINVIFTNIIYVGFSYILYLIAFPNGMSADL